MNVKLGIGIPKSVLCRILAAVLAGAQALPEDSEGNAELYAANWNEAIKKLLELAPSDAKDLYSGEQFTEPWKEWFRSDVESISEGCYRED